MILQALAALYGERLLPEGKVEPPGFMRKEIDYLVELDPQGKALALRSLGSQESEGESEDSSAKKGKRKNSGKKKPRGRMEIVPAEVKKSSGIRSNFLYENAEYVFGLPRAGQNDQQNAKVPERHKAFIARLQDLPQDVREDEGVAAVLAFLERGDFTPLQTSPQWERLAKDGVGTISFMLSCDPHGLVCQRPAVRSYVAERASGEGEEDISNKSKKKNKKSSTDASSPPPIISLISGRPGALAPLHPAIKGVVGAQPTGANIVSFNAEAFVSHGWKQGRNAPCSVLDTTAYTSALNWLLDRENTAHHLREGDTTFVFWAAQQDPFEENFSKHFRNPYVETIDEGADVAKKTLGDVRKGLKPEEDNDIPFYLLALAPNDARLAIRLWHEGTIGAIAKTIQRHFEDLEIDGLKDDDRVPTLYHLLGAAALKGDARHLQDQLRGNLAAAVMEAALSGTPYPATLLARTVDRCRAERAVWPIRAAVIKAVLRRQNHPNEKELSVSLDQDNTNPGYLLGRLFAVLESIQKASQGDTKTNVTIRDRFFASASATPRSAFVELMRLKMAHLKKLKRAKPGAAVASEKTINEITEKLSAEAGFPAMLSLDDQGRFIIGYHHQTHAMIKAAQAAKAAKEAAAAAGTKEQPAADDLVVLAIASHDPQDTPTQPDQEA